MQNSGLWTSIQVFMGTRPHLSFCACTRACIASEIQVSMGASPHHFFFTAKQRVWPVILCMKNRVISIRITSLYGSQPLSVAFACKPETFGAEFKVYLGPSPHLWFMYAKQCLVDQHTSPYVYQTSPVVLCIQNSVISTRITSLYRFQPSHVVLCIQNSVFWVGITNLYESQT